MATGSPWGSQLEWWMRPVEPVKEDMVSTSVPFGGPDRDGPTPGTVAARGVTALTAR
ncbi:hypothetical protein GCM10027451_49110 [Geodermatophilus aquaeductus]